MTQIYYWFLQVLRELRHIDNNKLAQTNNVIQLKGRVACEISNHELVLTELVFQNILSPLPIAEIAALLSCMVFQEKRCSEPELTESLKEVSVTKCLVSSYYSSHHNWELVLNELIFQNIISPLPIAEIAALLSFMLFQEKRCSEPELTE